VGTPKIYRVTSLSGGTEAGTLGACIAASGPRVCTFAVAGAIHAPTTGYDILNPYITIRGDTAPGQGVMIDWNGVSGSVDLFTIKTHDVVLRGLRLRSGRPWTGTDSTSGDSLRMEPRSTVGNGALNNVVVDHVSASWGSDQVVSINSMVGMPVANYPHDITISYSIAAEGLRTGSGSKCIMAVANNATSGPAMTNIDVHHNYFANCTRRFPEIRLDGDVRIVNNVLYNWGNDRQSFQNGVNGDLINNLGRRGPNTDDRPGYGSMFWVGYGDVLWTQTRAQTVHLASTKYYGGAVLGWDTSIVNEASNTSWGRADRRSSPLKAAASGPAIVPEAAEALATSVIGSGGAGHSRRLDCGGAWVSSGVRDSVDTRLAGEFLNPPSEYPGGVKRGCVGFTCWPVTVAETPSGGWPTIATVTTTCATGSRANGSCACADGDSDGIPDYWERAFCGAASGTGSCSALDSTVAAPWTNIEAFQSGSVVAP
jgi:hypothetical protein